MMKKIFITASLILISSVGLLAAEIKLESIELNKIGDENKVTIRFDKNLNKSPTLEIRPQVIQLEIPNTYVWPKIEKNVSLDGRNDDSTLTAYQFTREIVRFRTITSHDVSSKRDQIRVVHRGNEIDLIFPRTQADLLAERNFKQNRVATTQRSKIDESYLERLMREKKQEMETNSYALQQEVEDKNTVKQQKDEVSMTMSAVDTFNPNESSSIGTDFSLINYIGKFAAFLGLVLVLFYLLVNFLRKGFFKRSKLSLLGDTKVIEILNTTHIAPKKSLILLKVHNQAFLVGSTETGLNLISEITDLSKLFKSEEKTIAGNNFDTTMEEASSDDKTFSIKKDISLSFDEKTKKVQKGLSEFLGTEKKDAQGPNLTDQIKNKLKDLKSLQ